MEKFTEIKTVTAIDEMCSEPEKSIELTITNDAINLVDDGTVEVSYFSIANSKTIVKLFSEYPTDDEFETMIKNTEHCDYVIF